MIVNAQVDAFCQAEGIPVLMRAPFERVIAEGIARGRILTEIHPDFHRQPCDKFEYIAQEVKHNKVENEI